MRLITSLLLLLTYQYLAAQTNHWETAVYENDTWRYIVPTSEPDTNWRKPSFSAAAWNQGPGGFGFGDNDDNTTFPQSVSVFHRIAFNITDTSKLYEAILNVDYDDGFVAYLNNVEIARSNINTPGKPPYNTLAAGNHEAEIYQGGTADYFFVSSATLNAVLRPGNNVLAIQTHNVATNSSDLTSRVWMHFGITDNSVLYGPTPTWFTPPLNFTSSNLPIVVINTNNQAIPDDPKIMADMGIIWNGVGNRNYMTDPFNHYNGKVGIEVRGSSSQMFPKKSYGMELWDVNGNAIDSGLIGMPAESDWILSASYSDKSLLNNYMTYDLSAMMGWYASRCEFVEVVLNGQYIGVYVLMEKIKRDNNRVDLANLQPTDITGDELSGGYIIKIDKTTGNGGNGWTSAYAPDTAINGQTIYYQYEYPSETEIMPQQQAYIQAYVDSFETALAGPNYLHPTLGYKNFINMNSFIDYLLLNEMSRNIDGYRLSTFLYKDKDSNGGKLTIGPVWDYDIAWGNANYCGSPSTTGWAYDFALTCPGDYWQIPFWWDRFMTDTAFTNQLRCRWEELKVTALSVSYLHNYIDSMGVYLNESQQRNFQQWPILGQYVWPNPSPIPTTYQGELNELKTFITARWAWLDANIPGQANCNLTSTPTVSENKSNLALYPNPTNGATTLGYSCATPENITVTITDLSGRLISEPLLVSSSAGYNTVALPTTTLSAGTYIVTVNGSTRQSSTLIITQP